MAVLSPGLLTHWTRQALTAARDGDIELTAETTGRIADRADAMDLVAVCRVVADTALRALLALYGPPDAARGEAWVLDDVGDAGDRPDQLFSLRLVTAYANHDHDTVTALAMAAAGASPEERAESLWWLVTYAAELEARAARRNEQEKTDGN